MSPDAQSNSACAPASVTVSDAVLAAPHHAVRTVVSAPGAIGVPAQPALATNNTTANRSSCDGHTEDDLIH